MFGCLSVRSQAGILHQVEDLYGHSWELYPSANLWSNAHICTDVYRLNNFVAIKIILLEIKLTHSAKLSLNGTSLFRHLLHISEDSEEVFASYLGYIIISIVPGDELSKQVRILGHILQSFWQTGKIETLGIKKPFKDKKKTTPKIPDTQLFVIADKISIS